MRSLFFLLFTFLIQVRGYALDEKDSLLAVYKASFGAEKVKVLGELAIATASHNSDTAEIYASLFLSQIKGDDWHLQGIGFLALGDVGYYRQDFEVALDNYKKALLFFKKTNDSSRIASTQNNIGLIFYYQAKIDKALEAFEISLDIEKALGNKLGVAQAHQNIGLVFGLWENYEARMYHYALALSIFKELGDKLAVARMINNLGVEAARTGRYIEALEYYRQAYDTFNVLKNQAGLGSVAVNLANLFMYQDKYTQALEYFDIGEQIFKASCDTLNLLHVFSGKGDLYKALGEQKKSVDAFLLCEELNKSVGDRYTQMDNLYSLYRAYKSFGDSENAIRVLVDYHALKDSIFDDQKFEKLISLEKEFELAKKKNEFLKQQSELQRRVVVLVIAFSLVIVALVLVFISSRHKRMKEKGRRMVLEQKVLRTQMNPHFLFNSLSAIQCFILDQQPDEAVNFLGDFAQLMRMVLQYSQQEFITIAQEKNILDHYLRLQNKRFDDRINYEITFDEALVDEEVLIPPMLAQPFIENSLEHGDLARREDNFLSVHFSREDDKLLLNIEDNGVGLRHSQNKKKWSFSDKHNPLALKITKERLRLINDSSGGEKVRLVIHDKTEVGGEGTIVKFSLPYVEGCQ